MSEQGRAQEASSLFSGGAAALARRGRSAILFSIFALACLLLLGICVEVPGHGDFQPEVGVRHGRERESEHVHVAALLIRSGARGLVSIFGIRIGLGARTQI